jgi:hypothetical protein
MSNIESLTPTAYVSPADIILKSTTRAAEDAAALEAMRAFARMNDYVFACNAQARVTLRACVSGE